MNHSTWWNYEFNSMFHLTKPNIMKLFYGIEISGWRPAEPITLSLSSKYPQKDNRSKNVGIGWTFWFEGNYFTPLLQWAMEGKEQKATCALSFFSQTTLESFILHRKYLPILWNIMMFSKKVSYSCYESWRFGQLSGADQLTWWSLCCDTTKLYNFVLRWLYVAGLEITSFGQLSTP